MPLCLIVDDSPTVRLMVANNIRRIKESYDIIEAGNGRDALRMFEEQKPDIVFLDMKLGLDMTGLDVLRAMLAARPLTQVVIISGLSQEHPDVVEAMSIGAFSFLRKPIRVEVLETLLREIEKEAGTLRRVK